MRTGKSLFVCMIQRRNRDPGDTFRGQQWVAFEEKSRVLRCEEQHTQSNGGKVILSWDDSRWLIGANIDHRHLHQRVVCHHLAHF